MSIGDAGAFLAPTGSPIQQAKNLGLAIDVKRDYGASGSSASTTGTISAGSTTLTLASAEDFKNGQGISVAGAGASGALLVTTIVSGAGTTTLTLKDAASTAVTGAAVNHDDTAAIQAAVNAGNIVIPIGTFKVNSPVTVPSNRVIQGVGHGSVVATGSGFANNQGIFQATSETDITVQGVTFDFSANSQAGMKAVWFQSCQRTSVLFNKFIQGGDVIAHTGCSDFIVQGNICINGIGQTVIDNWGGCSRGVIDGNVVNGGGTSRSGILVTGINTDLSSNTTSDITVVGNTIYNTTDEGIWLQGGTGGVSPGMVEHCSVTGNIIDTVTTYHGIHVTEAQYCTISNNVIKNIAQRGISVTEESSGAVSHDLVISGNVLYNINTSATAGINAIDLVTSGASNNVIQGNHITNVANCDFAIGIASGAVDNAITGNVVTAGSTGTIQGQTGNYISGNVGKNPVGPVSPPASPLVSGTVYQNTYGVTVNIYQSAYATTSGTAGGVTAACGPTSTPNAVFTQQISGTSTSVSPDTLLLRVPSGWYYSFTASQVTLLNANILGE